MEKKNYNIEIFFESQKKSFVILSKNKITLDEVKARTIKEFNIPEEFEKDMRFSITIKNRLTTISNDFQIMKNFEEISKSNFYLKIVFSINNNNYIYQPPNKLNNKNKNKSQKIEKNEEFTIIVKTSNKKGDIKYIEEIKKLKEEIEKLKNEKNKKPDFDIRKFDEKFRDLNNKNNDLEQKIFELENENKTLKLNQSKNNVEIIDNSENKNNNDILIKRIQKVFSKLINEHDKKIIKEINEMKIKLDTLSKGQNIFEGKRQLNKNETDNNFELLNVDGETEKSLFFEKEENNNEKINKIIDTIDGENEKKDNKIIKCFNNIDEKNDSNIINLNNNDNNSDYLKNVENIINDNKNDKDNTTNKINDSDKDNKDEKNSYLESIIKRNINFYEEDENEKNSKSFDNSINNMNLKLKSKDKNSIRNIKDKFFENNKNKIPNCIFKKTSNNEAYSQFTIPNRIIEQEKVRAKNKKQNIKINNINNAKSNNHLTKRSNLSEEDIINYESNSELNSYNKNIKDKVNISKYKNTKIKKEKNRNINQINNYALNEETPTPFSYVYTIDTKKQYSYRESNKNEKYQSYTTPNIKGSSIREDIDNFFINVFQNIFFYGNNEYVNMLNISDKLTKKLKDGLITYRKNIKDVKDCAIKYISYSIIPIINDINTKEYQRKILKDKIKTILGYLREDINYFEKEYKNNSDNKSDKKSEERNINGINITHSKINEFRKLYDLKEKDYPDEMLIKALIRYRGNKEMAFQYLFY